MLTKNRFTYIAIRFSDAKSCQTGIVCDWSGDGKVKLRRSRLILTVGSEAKQKSVGGNFRMIDLIGDDLETALRKLDLVGVRGNIQPMDPQRGKRCPQENANVEPLHICDQTPPPGRGTSNRLFTHYLLAPPRPKGLSEDAIKVGFPGNKMGEDRDKGAKSDQSESTRDTTRADADDKPVTKDKDYF